ncbi:TonB-dependent receptor [Olivibacter ginsenosidimutans]|uniref:TonB-dependent receptor n=1 Tax=Olivibacter ginsenosidimutans TaxID=1176537 RepID=A0ABP9BZ31_9SPHI
MNFKTHKVGKACFLSKQCYLTLKETTTTLRRMTRLTVLFLTLTGLQIAQAGYAQQVSLHVKQASLKQVIEELSKQSGYTFFYDQKYLAQANPVSIQVNNQPITNVINQVFANQPFVFEIVDQTITLKPKGEMLHVNTRPQQSVVTGMVTDVSGEPLPGVSIRAKSTNKGTVTNSEGKFTLKDVPQGAILVFSYVGSQTKELPATAGTMKVVLQEDQDVLDEVVVVGYGAQKKSDLTGSIATVSSKDLENVNSPNIVDKLQGKVAGLSINTGNASPGATASISVRGENSITASNDPLIILDGIPFSGSMSDISPNTIANISVLKDASSTAIYGSRAANGVILITSKKGEVGKPRIAYNGYFGVQNVARRLPLMNGPEYLQYMHDYQVAMGRTGDELDPENYLFANVWEQAQKGIEVDWQDRIFKSNAPIQEHQLSFSGGNENATYYASAAYLNQEGVVKNSPFKRYNVNLNLNQNLNSWLKLGFIAQLTQSDNNGVQPSIDNAVKMSPYGKDRDENGNIVTYPMYAQTLYAHPFADENGINDETKRSVYANSFLDVKLPLEGLSFKTTFGINYRNTETGSYYGSNTLSGQGVHGYGEVTGQNAYDWTWENLLTYDRTFGDHKINVVGLYSAQKSKIKDTRLYGEDFVVDNGYNNLEAAANNKQIESGLVNTALLSYMGRINYSFKDRYLLTLTGRSDGYSAFSTDDRWAFFPSIAGAWVISSEDFFSSALINNLKLRLSYGKNGNQAISAYQTYDRFTNMQYLFGDAGNAVNGLALGFDAIGNKTLKWESTGSFNAGLDFGLFNSRINGSIDFYKTHTNDLLMSRQVPIMNGYNTIVSNIGKTKNLGLEVNLNTQNIIKDDFTWNSNLTFAYNDNEIVELTGDGKSNPSAGYIIGQPIRIFYDYKVIGVWQQDDDIANSWQPDAKPGDAKLADINGDGAITPDDRTVMGTKLPKYTLGIGNDFTYKGFGLSFFMNGAFGVTKEDNFTNVERFVPGSGANYLSDMDYWTPENPSNEVPSPGYVPVNTHKYYINAAFWRIRDLTLSYTFKGEKLDKLHIGSIRTYINARNLYTFTKVKGYNPEALTVSSTTGNPTSTNILSPYPVPRVFSLGVNVQF